MEPNKIEQQYAKVLRFGIPSMDRLVDPVGYTNYRQGDKCFGFHYEPNEAGKIQAVSCCLIGPEGTGKSVFAMHAAAHYLYITPPSKKVIYLSTDLNHQKANAIFRNFALNQPCARTYDPFDKRFSRWHSPSNPLNLVLKHIEPNDMVECLLTDERAENNSLLFLDLARNTVGDDWGYINRLVASLPMPEPGEPLHLLVVDAVEGLEILVGNTDAFGQNRDQRSKIAQLLRTAIEKCHIIFVNEEADASTRTPTEFVSDLVIRLGFQIDLGYSRRVLEVIKSRGQSHVRGLHDFAIRSGRGSTTGNQENSDDPKVLISDRPQSYVYVFPSVHAVSRQLMEEEGKALNTSSRVRYGFGIKYLDSMLDGQTQAERRKSLMKFDAADRSATEIPGDPVGVLGPKMIAVLGEHQTYKSRLCRAFLSRVIKPNDNLGVAILLTTKVLEATELAKKLMRHRGLDPKDECNEDLYEKVRGNVICRRLEIHYLSPSVFLHIVDQLIREAQEILEKNGIDMSSEEKRRNEGWRIRLAIDDWTTIGATFPELDSEQKLLPALAMAFSKAGIATVFKGNELYGYKSNSNSRCAQLADLSSVCISTWRVHFFGESRIAIEVNPPGLEEGRNDAVRELRSMEFSGRRHDHTSIGLGLNRSFDNAVLSVNPFFELYKGLREGKPQHVKLEIKLFSEIKLENHLKKSNTGLTNCDVGENENSDIVKSIGEYVTDVNQLFQRLLGKPERIHIEIVDSANYSSLREYSELQGISRYDETVVLQVDEFWSKPGPLTLKNQLDYLFDETCFSHGQADRLEDPFRLFQPTNTQLESKTGRNRASCFSLVGYDLDEHRSNHERTIVKVPYFWDFGFLCFDQTLVCSLLKEQPNEDSKLANLIDKYQLKLSDHVKEADSVKRFLQNLSWHDFANLCVVVRKFLDSNVAKSKSLSDLVVFGPYYGSAENIPCLALEIFASELAMDFSESEKITDCFPAFRHDNANKSLVEIVSENKVIFLKSALLMAAMIDSKCISELNRTSEIKWDQMPFVFSRQWYSTACRWQSDGARQCDNIYDYCGLPGLYTARGDWFLAITKGSRSYRMGERAIDILCSRRANIVRLQNGMGLPVRGSEVPTEAELWSYLDSTQKSRDEIVPNKRKFSEILGWGPEVEYQQHGTSTNNKIGRPGFNWLWRSRIRLYERHSRIWRRWLIAFLNATKEQSADHLLKEYDDLNQRGQTQRITDFAKGKWVNDLISTLQKATLIA